MRKKEGKRGRVRGRERTQKRSGKEDREPRYREEERRGVVLHCWLQAACCFVVWVVKMSSPCLLRAAPISQTRHREVKISLKTGVREPTVIQSSGGGTKEAASRTYARTEKEAPVRVTMSSNRSRSTPAVYRAQKPDGRKSGRGSSSRSSGGGGGGGKPQEPEHHPEKNGTILHIPLTVAPIGISQFSTSSSSSSSCTPRRQRPSHLHPPPVLLSSSSSSSSGKSMKRARWLSYSTSNIYFNSILDGRFRQLQGTGILTDKSSCCCCCVKARIGF